MSSNRIRAEWGIAGACVAAGIAFGGAAVSYGLTAETGVGAGLMPLVAAVLIGGLITVLTPEHLLFALLGCVIGMLLGVLPDFGPAAAVSLLIPVTFGLDATTAIIMLAAILYGAAYGGTITAVLLRIPGEASSIATTLDG